MPASLRTIVPFLRTARLSLRHTQSPLVSLQRETRTPAINFARTYATAYQRTKPHVNIGMHRPPCIHIRVLTAAFQAQLAMSITERFANSLICPGSATRN